MNYLVIYPGRFHPFHRGHKASYDWLVKKFGEGSVYIATSDVQNPEDSPFSYSDKVAMTTRLGIPASRVVQVKNPYRADEIIGSLSAEEKQTTALIFAVSEKDTARFNFKPKKDGSPSYLQPLPENLKKLKPMLEHGYIAITPTVNFRVRGVDADSASAIRKMYLDGNDNDRNQIITDLYGSPDPELKSVFDQKLGVNKLDKTVTYGKEIIDGGLADQPMHESRAQKLKENIQFMREKLRALREKRLAEGEVIPFPGKPIPPNLEQAQKLAYKLVDTAYNSKGDPRQKITELRQQLKELGYRVRGAGRGIELVNDQHSFKQLIEPFDYLEEKKSIDKFLPVV